MVFKCHLFGHALLTNATSDMMPFADAVSLTNM